MNSRGFTLIEVLMTIALVSAVAGLSLPISERWIVSNDLALSANTVAQSIRRAQVLAQTMSGDSAWGVAIDSADNNSIIIFQGDSFAGRDSAWDEIFDFPASLSVSGVQEIVFEKLTGSAQTTGTITLTSNNGQSIALEINEKGIVSY